ncbi:MAG: DUF3450 family protein [Myxococcota bacterium]|nr:DUF3450 family protein [Myxococcota bacterium]
MARLANASLACLVLAAAGAPSHAEGGVDGFRTKMEKWVETRQLISQERADWEVEQETMRASRKLLGQEKEALEAEIAELEETNTQSDDERRDLLLERGEYQRANRALEARIRALEEDVLALAPRLPGPLQQKLELLLVQIPEDPEQTTVPLGQRLMSVLGVLAQAEKFNGTATFVGETRAVDGDQKVAVRTLYWGLGQAVYVDARGETAGIGRPGPEGWEFSNEPELAAAAARLLDIYEGNVDAIEFVPMPVAVESP